MLKSSKVTSVWLDLMLSREKFELIAALLVEAKLGIQKNIVFL